MIMILFQHWYNQCPPQLDPGVEISYDIFTPFNNQDKVLFALSIYFVKSVIILELY